MGAASAWNDDFREGASECQSNTGGAVSGSAEVLMIFFFFKRRKFPETVSSERRNGPKIIGVEDTGFLSRNISFTNKIKSMH